MNSLRVRLLVIIGASLILLWTAVAAWMMVELRGELRTALDDRLAASARMVGLDARGFDVEVTLADGARRVRIPFPAPATTPDAVRKTVMAMLAKARKG